MGKNKFLPIGFALVSLESFLEWLIEFGKALYLNYVIVLQK